MECGKIELWFFAGFLFFSRCFDIISPEYWSTCKGMTATQPSDNLKERVWSGWNALLGALETGGDCRVLIPPETWSGLTRNPPSGIRTPDLKCF